MLQQERETLDAANARTDIINGLSEVKEARNAVFRERSSATIAFSTSGVLVAARLFGTEALKTYGYITPEVADTLNMILEVSTGGSALLGVPYISHMHDAAKNVNKVIANVSKRTKIPKTLL